MIQLDATDRFLRPLDLARTRRNHRQLQAQKVLATTANVLLAVAVVLAISWVISRAKEDSRFALRHLEVAGAHQTAKGDIDRAMARYRGSNLFRLDTASVTADLQSLPWVQSAAIEKRLPDTLVVHIAERTPAALFTGSADGKLRYVDRGGAVFATLSTEVGDPDLPVISSGTPGEISECTAFLEELRGESPQLYARVSEIRKTDGGFRLFDRQLSVWISVSESDVVAKWTDLSRVMTAEGYGKGAVEYADLRFRDRLVVKPHRLPPAAVPARVHVSGDITN